MVIINNIFTGCIGKTSGQVSRLCRVQSRWPFLEEWGLVPGEAPREDGNKSRRYERPHGSREVQWILIQKALIPWRSFPV